MGSLVRQETMGCQQQMLEIPKMPSPSFVGGWACQHVRFALNAEPCCGPKNLGLQLLKKHDKTNTQITQNSHTLLGIACSVPKWSHCDGGNYRCDDPFHESVRNHETAKPSWDTARGRKESKELTVNIISHILYHTISDRHGVDQILRAAYVTQTWVAKLSGAEDAESEKPKVGDPEVRKVHFET